MGRMESDVGVRRLLLRQRLRQLIAQDTPATTTIDAQIEELLQDILDEDLAPLPALAWPDDRDEDQEQRSHQRSRRGGPPMTWNTPTLVEICIGLEINGYLPPEF